MNVLAILFLIVGVLSIGYCVAIVSYTGFHTAFLWFWILAGIGSLIFAFILRYLQTHNIIVMKSIRIIFMTVFIVGISVFVLMEGIIIHTGRQLPDPGADYIIVLGA